VQPRQYLYIVVGGECKYIRSLNIDKNTNMPVRLASGNGVNGGNGNKNNNLSTADGINTNISTGTSTGTSSVVDYEVGVSLFGGDFSFMEGEWTLPVDKKNSISSTSNNNSNTGTSSSGTNNGGVRRDWIKERIHKYNEMLIRNKNYIPKTLHDFHKLSLISITRVELCCIPLIEIHKCKELFTSLLQVSLKKYPILSYSDDDFQNYIIEMKKYKSNLKSTLLQIEADLIHSSLPHHESNYINCYLSKDNYEAMRTKKKLHIATHD